MLQKAIGPALFALALAAYTQSAFAHEEHHGGGSGHDGHAGACQEIVPKSQVTMPSLNAPDWTIVKVVAKEVGSDAGVRTFVYTFYANVHVPGVRVAAATLVTEPSSGLTSVMWETGDKKFATVLEARNATVCVAPLYGTDGNKYDLTGFMEKISAWAER